MSDLLGSNVTMKMLERGLDFMAERHKILVANVANEETPRFKAKDMEFRSVLTSMVQPGIGPLPMTPVSAEAHPRHLPLPGATDGVGQPQVADVPGKSVGLDGNTVSVEKTMAAIDENSMLYSAASQILAKKYQGLLTAISSSR